MRYWLTICFVIAGVYAYAQQDTIHVYFDAKSTELNTAAFQTIDSNIYYDILTKGKHPAVIYYTNSNKRNAELSSTRADAVIKYVISMGIPEADITVAESKYNVPRGIKNLNENPLSNRVDIIPGGISLTLSETVNEAPIPSDTKPITNLTTITKNETIRLEHVEFKPGTDILLDEAIPTLQSLYETLDKNPDINIQIEGHVCCANMYHLPEHPSKHDYAFKEVVQEEAMSLSLKRANKVYDYLIKKGISKKRLSTKGFGHTVPIYDADGKTINKQKNRRVEIRIMEK
jgi:outer membrane protein OmpA-like peptidoglycan-associated protein